MRRIIQNSSRISTKIIDFLAEKLPTIDLNCSSGDDNTSPKIQRNVKYHKQSLGMCGLSCGSSPGDLVVGRFKASRDP